MQNYYNKKIQECESQVTALQNKAGQAEGAEFERMLAQMEKINTELNNYKQALSVMAE